MTSFPFHSWGPAALIGATPLISALVLFSPCGDSGVGGGSGAVGGGGGGGRPPTTTRDATADDAPDDRPGTPPIAPEDAVSFFVSGHSLTDDPLAEDIANIARSLGLMAQYDEQISIGSPIRLRTRGGSSSGWAGYSTGKNRTGSGMNVISELARPTTIEGAYGSLIITERHDLVNTLMWEETVRLLRNFHDRLVAGNPAGTTYFYHSWLDITSRSDLWPFINYERKMFPAWECVAERVETSLKAEGSQSHVVVLPAGIALTDLLEAAIEGNVPGVSGASTTDVTNKIFDDSVHLTRLGVHYMALVSFATVYRRSPVGAAAAPGIDPATARALQEIAWSSVSAHNHTAPRGLAQCRAYMRTVACDAFGAYHSPGAVSGCKSAFADENRTGPFYYAPATDEGYWFPAQ